ncbi:hypothetical protein B5F79_05170 [Olsenella sp. An285]|uniref:DUF7601 domain-containing protein n=1 Tax=Olsenella sp. An285 TaxID=1965621 RepID=UPI000B39AFC0|nr:VWA domain-containing protein [Olsenella sp. An285]OUO47323.1 hypothetical protein B5F79_05170 [Olsenella sp. An285]
MRRRPGARRGLAALAVVAALFAGAPALAVGEPSPGDPTSGDSAIVQVDEIADDQVTEPGQGTEVPGAGTEVPGEGETGDESQEPVETYVAQIGDVQYTSIDEAIADAESGSTVTLLQDVTASATFYKSLTFTGGYKLTVDAYSWRYSGDLVFDGASFEMVVDGDSPEANNGEIVRWLGMSLSNGSIVARNHANVTFSFDSTSGTNCAIYATNADIIVENASSFSIYGENTKGVSGQGIQLNSARTAGIRVTGNSSFLIDGTNRGYVCSPDIYVEDSSFTVQNCTNNASNGGQFEAHNSTVSFLNNNGHGLSTADLTIDDESKVYTNGNTNCGIVVTGALSVKGGSYVETVGNKCMANSNWSKPGAICLSGNGVVEAGSTVSISDNAGCGIYLWNNDNSNPSIDLTNGNVTIQRNNAEKSGLGGGIYNEGTCRLGTGVAVYNNHAPSAGDDIYNIDGATLEFVPVGSEWYLDGDPDCSDLIDGWYLDGAIESDDGVTIDSSKRWEAHATNFSDNYAELFDPFTVVSGTTETNEPESDAKSIPVISALTSLFSGANSADGSDGGESDSSQNTGGAAESTDVATVTGPLAIKAAHGIKPLDPSNPDDPNSPDWEISKSKTATNLDANYESQVTLALPAADLTPEIDVVLVVDVSSSMKDVDVAEAKAAATAMCDELAGKQNLDINVGIVTFDKTAHNLTNGLVSIEEAKAAIETISASSDTNMMAGLIAGKEMLDTGTADESCKYMVLMSDGIPIYWVDDNGDPIGKELIRFNTSLEETSRVFAGSEPEGSITGDAAIEYIGEMLSMDELMSKTDVENDSNEWKQISDTGETVNSDECRYTNIEKSTYMTGKYLQESVLSKYKLKMVAFGTDKYENNVVYTWGEKFCDWIGEQVGEENYFKVSKPGYGGEEGDLTNAFDEIADSLVYLVDAGSRVVDVIGYGDDYDMKFLPSLEKLEMTVGGTVLDEAEITEGLSQNETARFGFGKDSSLESGYKFVLHYYENGEDSKSEECFVWDINVAVTVNDPVKLAYAVKLQDPKTATGIYGQYDEDGSEGYPDLLTNKEAVLYPVDSNGKDGWPEAFPKPTVSYVVGTATVTPAEITIYMGGDKGYEGVLTGEGEDDVLGEESNSLPEPGYYVQLPDSINDLLQQEIQGSTTTDEEGEFVAVNLGNIVKVTAPGGKEWTLKAYGTNDATSTAYSRFVYRIEATGDTPAVRLEFSAFDESGNPTGDAMVSDRFDPAEMDTLQSDYAMRIYPGENDEDSIVMTITIGGVDYQLPVKLGVSTLHVRYVNLSQDEAVTKIETGAEAESTILDKMSDQATSDTKNAFASVPDGTTFTINNSSIDLDEDYDPSPSLLFDDVTSLDDAGEEAGTEYADQLGSRAIATAATDLSNPEYEVRYLDLVDANNGNVWLKASNPVTVYWPYPEGTDSSDDFHLVHFTGEGLDRDVATSDIATAIDGATATTVVVTKLEHGIKFETSSFSPFALVWGTTGGTIIPGDDEGDLTISKEITGNLASTDDAFTFTVTVEGVNGTVSTSAGDIEFNNGTATITLKGGQSITIYGLPEGAEYAVVETDANGYKLVSAVGDEGEITDGTVASFTNDKSETVDPDDPDDPDTPDEPDDPDTPDEPDEPDTPDTPDDPDEPDTPDTPDTPDEPDQPSDPGKPSKPSQPSKPSEPVRPNVPDTGDHTNAALPVLLALGGAALVGGALWVKVRKDH